MSGCSAPTRPRNTRRVSEFGGLRKPSPSCPRQTRTALSWPIPSDTIQAQRLHTKRSWLSVRHHKPTARFQAPATRQGLLSTTFRQVSSIYRRNAALIQSKTRINLRRRLISDRCKTSRPVRAIQDDFFKPAFSKPKKPEK